MALVDQIKMVVETVTGLGRPGKKDLPRLIKRSAPRLHRFEDDGKTPNNPNFPVIIYRSAVRRPRGLDPAAIYEALFAANGWKDSWRDRIYDFLHFHTRTHEALGIARGHARVQFGGEGAHVNRQSGRCDRPAGGDRPSVPFGQRRPAGGRRLSERQRRL